MGSNLSDRCAPANRTAASLPPTVNLHLVAHCNMRCRYCYARFYEERTQPRLATEQIIEVMRDLAAFGVRRVTFAGGEPTLHPDLARLLSEASELGLVTSVVTNASRIDAAWLSHHGPHLRWLTLSIDSVQPEGVIELGRRTKAPSSGHVDQVISVASLVHEYNRVRPRARRLRLKVNITVTSANAHEDPTPFVRTCRPEKVKVLQMLLVAGENDDARDLQCPDDAFATYVGRVRALEADGIEVVEEDDAAMDGSYAMVDPLGRFYQRVDGRYVRSRPINDVGALTAWGEVGGYDAEAFVNRGGAYDPGEVARGNLPYLIAIEGLDGTGKSTVAARVAEVLGATLIRNPPDHLAEARTVADCLPPDQRRAWYLEANRIAADGGEQERAGGLPVVMDRSAASTIVFGEAEQGRIAASAHWPTNLPRPDALLVLELPESERLVRLTARGSSLTAEEQVLAADEQFRNRVRDGYVQLGARVVPGGGSIEDVVARVLEIVRS